MIVPALPPELGQFVEQQIATGRYSSEDELVVDAVRVLQRVTDHEHEFHDAVRQGMEQLASGEFTEYNDDSLRELFDSLKRRALRHTNPSER
jgi:putative addiction module CopG family antidote